MTSPASRILSVFAAALLVGAWVPTPARAVTYYVDQGHPNASDANPGTAEDAPWLTLARAMTVVASDTVYVKRGSYAHGNSVHNGQAWLRPASSGRPDARIAFRAVPGHQVVLEASISGGVHNNYVTWDGFTLAPGTYVRLYGASSNRIVGTILENLTIQRGPIPVREGNYDGIFLQYTSQTVIRNSMIRDVYYSDSHFVNASGIKLYFNDRALIEHNEIYRTNVAIFDKAGGEFNVFRNNHIHDVFNTGIVFACFGHDHAPCRGGEIYQNVIATARKVGLAIGNDVVPHIRFQDFKVYNNTIHNVPVAISNGTTPGLGLWNNILSATESAMLLRNVPTDIALSDFSNFYPAARFASERTTYATLSMWQRGTELDRHSIRQDPLFTSPLTGDFRLQPASPARGTGREGGVTTGTPVDMGAYPTGAERIGPCGQECR